MCGETACVDRIPVSIPYVADGSIVKQTPLPKPDVVSGEPLVKITLSLRIIPKLAEPLQLLGKMSPSTSSAGAVEASIMSNDVAFTKPDVESNPCRLTMDPMPTQDWLPPPLHCPCGSYHGVLDCDRGRQTSAQRRLQRNARSRQCRDRSGEIINVRKIPARHSHRYRARCCHHSRLGHVNSHNVTRCYDRIVVVEIQIHPLVPPARQHQRRGKRVCNRGRISRHPAKRSRNARAHGPTRRVRKGSGRTRHRHVDRRVRPCRHRLIGQHQVRIRL